MKKIPSIKTLVANDIDKAATDLMTKNFEFNECPETKFKGKYYHSYPSLILF
jgi:tRNA G26 N,N-dimethylase Trm1